MKYILVILLVFLINTIYSECKENQIDINSASLSELDKLAGIGEAKSQAMINSRPFEEIDDLINVYGIGEATLDKIKEQNLACVDEEKEDEEEIGEEIDEEKVKRETNIEENSIEEPKQEIVKESVETIKISKNIKTYEFEENKEPSEKNKSFYLLLIFCVLLAFLFTIKKIKVYKNEFD